LKEREDPMTTFVARFVSLCSLAALAAGCGAAANSAASYPTYPRDVGGSGAEVGVADNSLPRETRDNALSSGGGSDSVDHHTTGPSAPRSVGVSPRR
jgi:hypothetical protein